MEDLKNDVAQLEFDELESDSIINDTEEDIIHKDTSSMESVTSESRI